MQKNSNTFGEQGELIIDTFPEIPNSIKDVSDGVEFTYGMSPDVSPVIDFEEAPEQKKDFQPTEVKKEEKKKASKSNVKFEVVKKQKEAQFSVPDRFTEKSDEKEDKEISAPKNIWTTYVPSFTEASEKYRLGIYRPAVAGTKREEEAEDSKVDPTVEIEEIEEEPIVENVVVPEIEEPKENTAKMFKFFTKEETADIEPAEEEVPAPEPEREPFYKEEEPEAQRIGQLRFTDAKTEETTEEKAENVFPKITTIEYAEKERRYEEPSSDIGDKIVDGDRKEYTVFSQRESFINKFLDSIMSVKIRFFTSLVLAFLLLVAENLYLFGVDIPKFLGMNAQGGAMAILELIFEACLYFLAIPEIVLSFKRLIEKQLVPEIYLSIALLLLGGYTTLCIFYANEKYTLFGLLFALMCLSSVGASYFKRNAEHSAFDLISQNGEKRIIDIKNTRELDRENMALDGAVKEHLSKTARFFRTTFISGFVARSRKCSENSKNVLMTLLISFGIGIVGGVIGFFVPGGIVSAFGTLTLTFMLSVSVITFLSHKLPYLAVTEEFKKEKTAFIGEKAVLDYSEIDVITFEDVEVFGEDDVNLQRIMLYGKNENLSAALKQMSALFQKVGGPLDKLFSNSLDRKCPPAYNTFVEEDGVSGEIDFRPVCAGTMDYMLRHRIEFPEEEGRQQTPTSNTTRVIYAAENGVVYAKFFIRYSFSEEFSMLLPILEEEEIIPLIYTRDPNITPEFIRTLTAGNEKIRIMKKRTSPFDDDALYRRVNCGAVVLGDKMNAINSLLLTKRYARMAKKISDAEIVLAVVGAVAATALSLLSLGTIPTIVFALFEGAAVGGLFAYVRKKIYISPFQSE